MRRLFTGEDIKSTAQLGAIFVAVGAVFGLFRDGDPVIGAVAGLILYGIVIGIGLIATWADRRFDRPWS
ncbi:hypothetical protein [Methylocapsa sp. S129]|uniref:hypothetical protein n=1 Tax=Methylocapsa sp. S129 TaxID=1641869 RepID=UPI00131AF0B2|nr:hypothetical protein [Methylocapsa sp. S129]